MALEYSQNTDDVHLQRDFHPENSNYSKLSVSSTWGNIPVTRSLCAILCAAAIVISVIMLVLLGIQMHNVNELDRKVERVSDTTGFLLKAINMITGGSSSVDSGTSSPDPQTHTDATQTTSNWTQPTVVMPDLTECVVSGGHEAGNRFSDNSTFINYGKMTGLEIRVKQPANELTGIRAKYGFQYTEWRGNFGGEVTYVWLDSEVITSVTLYEGYHAGYSGITGIAFTTSRGTTRGPYGTVSHSFTVGVFDELLYFSGKCGGIIDALEVHARGCHDIS